MSDPIFCGSARTIPTKYGDMLKITFRAEDLQRLNDNVDNGFVSATVHQKQNPAPDKPPYYLKVDKWKPNPQYNASDDSEAPAVNINDDEPLPF